MSVGSTIGNDYFSNAYDRLLAEIQRENIPEQQTTGVLQLITAPSRWAENAHMRIVSSTTASAIAQRPVDSSALYFPQAGTLVPRALCDYWLSNATNVQLKLNTPIHAISKTDTGWQLHSTKDSSDSIIAQGALIVLANSNGVNQLIPDNTLPLVPVSGQMSHFKASPQQPQFQCVVCNKGHVIPTQTGSWAGATYHRDKETGQISAADDQANALTLAALQGVAVSDHAANEPRAVESWAGVRCTTPDRLPVVGGVADTEFYREEFRELHHGRKYQKFAPARFHDGLYVLAGFGSRGATQAVYAAECLAQIISGDLKTDPLILSALHPGRFLINRLRRPPLQ